jgi:deoxyribose-phosphate aldolase
MQKLNSKTITYEQLAKTIDHSLLKPEMTEAEVIAGCELARTYHVASVCVKPCHVATAIKAAEARQAMADGAVELDMVINIGELRSGHAAYVQEDIRAVVEAAKGRALVKVILENAYLTNEEKALACRLAEAAGADFVKTSTGFAPSGATIEDLKLMRASVGPRVQVKAAGGVRTLDAILAVIDTGATRVGATATAAILDEFKKRQNQP